MRLFALLAFFAVLIPVPLAAQSASAAAVPVTDKAQIPEATGVLIGLGRLYDDQIARSVEVPTFEDRNSAAFQRQTSGKQEGEKKPIRYDTAPEESPYATVWLAWTSEGLEIRVLRDVIVPRKDGFWKFGINHSGVSVAGANNAQDFFWLAPLGAAPALAHAKEDFGAAQASTRRLTYIDSNYFSYRELGQYSGGTYWEGESGSVRSLDLFAKGPPKEAEYEYENPGLSVVQVLGSGVKLEFEKIAKDGDVKDSEGTQSSASAEEDPCAGSGYVTSETDWYIVHQRDRWQALLGLRSSGPGKCDRQTDWRPLEHDVPAQLSGSGNVPVPWSQIEKVFPDARHAFVSPKGDWITVLARNKIYFVRVIRGALGKTAGSAEIPFGVPVMAQWAIGKYVKVWSKQLSAVPPPNDSVFFTFDSEN